MQVAVTYPVVLSGAAAEPARSRRRLELPTRPRFDSGLRPPLSVTGSGSTSLQTPSHRPAAGVGDLGHAAVGAGGDAAAEQADLQLFDVVGVRRDDDLAAVLALRGKLTSGYHRDFQLLKEPMIRGLGRALELFGIAGLVLPRLEVDSRRAREALRGDLLATDEVLRRVERGTPFRAAYREVAAALRRGEPLPAPSPARLLARRRSEGGLGHLGLAGAWKRWRAVERWLERERSRFDTAMGRLAGTRRRSRR